MGTSFVNKTSKVGSLPLVSVIVPVYNASKTLDRTMDSLLHQTYPHLEIILVDDGSKDDGKTSMLLYAYSNLSENIKVIRNKTNKGVSAARNLGLRASTGDFITFLDADDWFEPYSIEKQLQVLQDENCKVAIQGYVVEQPNAVLYEHPLPFAGSTVPSSTLIERYLSLDPKKRVAPSCALLLIEARYLKARNILFHEEIRYMEDLLFVCSVVSGVSKVACAKSKTPYHYMNEYVSGITDRSWQKKYNTYFAPSVYRVLQEIKPFFGGNINQYNAFKISKYLEIIDKDAVSNLSWSEKITSINRLKLKIKTLATKEVLEYLPRRLRYTVGLRILNSSTSLYIAYRFFVASIKGKPFISKLNTR